MKKLAELKSGARFLYGGVEWVKLDELGAGCLSLAAEPVFERAFDEENCNDWRKASLRRELNGPFLDALVQEGADRDAFKEFDSDLTADDGMTDYGRAADKIALISCDLYRKFRAVIPSGGNWWWTLTPWTCDPEYSYDVRCVTSSGTLSINSAHGGDRGVRPLCNLEPDNLVSAPGEESQQEERNAYEEAVQGAQDAIFETMNDFPAEVWGDALGAAVASLMNAKINAEGVRLEDNARRALK